MTKCIVVRKIFKITYGMAHPSLQNKTIEKVLHAYSV